MIRRQLVQWVLLPRGLTTDGMLAASVFVSPRLRPGDPATLADFPDFADWPTVVQGADFVLERPDGGTEAPMSVQLSASGPLWTALFPATTPVRPFRFEDLSHRPLVSYPVGEVLGHLRERWSFLAAAALDDLPVTSRNAAPIGPGLGDGGRRTTLADSFLDLRAVSRRGHLEGAGSAEEVSDRLRRLLDDAAAAARAARTQPGPPPLITPFGTGGGPTDAFYALAGFHARPTQERPRSFPADRDAAAAEFADVLDFHAHLSALGDHPALLRDLGLALDLVIRPDFVPQTVDGGPSTRLRLRVRRDSAFPDRRDDPTAETWNADVTPWTACRLTTVDFQAFFSAAERTADSDFVHGFLRMDPTRITPEAVDVDGLALKALAMAATLETQDTREQRPVEEPERAGIPSARTGGVAVVQHRRADGLHQDFLRARTLDDALEQDPGDPAPLAAEDLVRGYRMDVLLDGRWHSLHDRRVSYSPGRDPAERREAEDEGFLEVSLTAEADRPDAPADPDRPLYVHEQVVTWEGWSLSVPRPGAAVAQRPAPPAADDDVTGLRLAIRTEPPVGALPRLRFGSRYRVRLRTVDLAGGSHTLASADHLSGVLDGTGQDRYRTTAPDGDLTYRRFEPVPPPDLVPRLPFGPGESLERLAIRSSPDLSAAAFAEASQAAVDPSLRFRPFCDRHVAAAKASLQLVEAHGLLDEAMEAVRGLDPADAAAAVADFHRIAARESGSFADHPAALPVVTGEHQGAPQGYACIDVDAVDLPWLPDPLAAGVRARLWFHDGSEQVLEIEFADGGGWERPLPFRLRLDEGDPAAGFDASERLLTVTVPPGRTARLRLSSLFRGDPDVFGVLAWCRQELGTTDADRVADAVAGGTHWLTAPWRDLVLVHALQRPLEPARLDLDLPEVPGFAFTAALRRPEGATAADLAGRFEFDVPSTARLDVSASWEEVRDDPARTYDDAAEMTAPVTGEAFSLSVPDPAGTPWQPEIAQLVEPQGDDVIGFRTATPDETAERMRLRLLEDAAAPGLAAPERRRLEGAAAQLAGLRSHELGDTRYRRVTYQPVASTRFREYFDPAMPAADGCSPGDPVIVEVLSSARPTPPSVLQVLPLMERQVDREADGTTTSRRTGVGLRVWLGRPWFSSGDGEMLAVVCGRGGPLTPDSELSREITVLAQDPAHVSAVPRPLVAASFPLADELRENLPLAGSGLRRDIVAFRPRWDAGQQAWFCDVRFDPGATYFPFARLCLARYQRHSIPGRELSPLVPTAFTPVLPSRTLRVAPVAGATSEVILSGPAPSASVGADGGVVAATNLVAASVEARDPRIADPLLGWSPVGPETVLPGAVDAGGTATWHGPVPVPDGGGAPLRIAVREYEMHPADDRSAFPSPGLTTVRRLVSADVVPV